jgi:flagellar biogenesis protein FliO
LAASLSGSPSTRAAARPLCFITTFPSLLAVLTMVLEAALAVLQVS